MREDLVQQFIKIMPSGWKFKVSLLQVGFRPLQIVSNR
jgi:hypothetical protein